MTEVIKSDISQNICPSCGCVRDSNGACTNPGGIEACTAYGTPTR